MCKMKGQVKKSPYYSLSLSKSRKIISPNNIRFVQRDVRLQKYHKIFVEISKNAIRCCQRKYQTKNVFKILNKIIPMTYFGTMYHRRLFYDTVKLILTQSQFECVYVKELTINYDVKQIPWLSTIVTQNLPNSKKVCGRYLSEAQIWLLEKIVKPVILRLYSVVKKGLTYELELVPKPIWSSFRQKAVKQLIAKKHLLPTKFVKQSRGILELRPKDGYNDPNSYRPIIKLRPNQFDTPTQKQFTKSVGRILRSAAQNICPTKTTSLYTCWKDYLNKIEGKKIYGAKIDVQDAFGNINIGFMIYILNNLQENGKIPTGVVKHLTQHIQNQYVVCDKHKNGQPKVWQWNHGLCQGDRYSSSLCQLYMSYLDSVHLKHLYKPTSFVHRTVDDYLFCSTNEDDVVEFIKIMNSLYTLNKHKTQSNAAGYNNNAIHYYGQILSLETGEAKTLYNFPKRAAIRHRFKLWNMKRPIYNKQRSVAIQAFLMNTLKYSTNNYYFKNMILNTIINTEETVLDNYFESVVYLAFKFDVVIMALKNIIHDYTLIINFIKKMIYKYSQKAFRKLQQNKGRNHTGTLRLCHFLKIALQAFVLVFKKRTCYKQKTIVDHLKKSMQNISQTHFIGLNFFKFRELPKFFNNISMQRRLPHHCSY